METKNKEIEKMLFRRISVLLIGVVLGVFLAIGFAQAKDVTVNFSWDADVVSEDHIKWEELRLYERTESGGYDYSLPNATIPQTYETAGDPAVEQSTPVTYTHTTTVPDGQSTTLYWTIRSAANLTSSPMESADSEEVSMTFDLTPLTIPTSTAVFNDTSKSIDFSWPTQDPRATSWKIFNRLAGATDWMELATVDSSGSTSIPLDTLFPAGEKTTQEFTMVAYGALGVFSPDALTTSITVNRVPPSGVINFKIQLVE